MMRRQARSSTRITGRRELHDLGSRACHTPYPIADLTIHHEPDVTRLRRSPAPVAPAPGLKAGESRSIEKDEDGRMVEKVEIKPSVPPAS